MDIKSTLWGKLADIPTLGACKIHLEQAIRENDILRAMVKELEEKVTRLEREMSNALQSLHELEGEDETISIGPCRIKKADDGSLLPGFYCLLCKITLTETKHKGKPVLHCGRCNATFNYLDAKKALSAYLQKSD